jgi:hypothetical protein
MYWTQHTNVLDTTHKDLHDDKNISPCLRQLEKTGHFSLKDRTTGKIESEFTRELQDIGQRLTDRSDS